MDPLAKKIGDKAAQAMRQQIKDISEEVKELPKSGKQQITGEDEVTEQLPDSKKQNTQSGKQQILTLLRGGKKQSGNQSHALAAHKSAGNDDTPQKPMNEYLDRDISKARGEREEKESQRQSALDQLNQMQEPEHQKPFVAPKGRKPRGMQNPLARKGEKKNELGRTAKG